MMCGSPVRQGAKAKVSDMSSTSPGLSAESTPRCPRVVDGPKHRLRPLAGAYGW